MVFIMQNTVSIKKVVLSKKLVLIYHKLIDINEFIQIV